MAVADVEDCESSIEGPDKQQLFRRTCTKVLMEGKAVGRAIDLSLLDSYDELITVLENWFEIKGEMRGANKNWMMIYRDYDGEIIVVGDDPWADFREVVKQIEILSCNHVRRMMLSGALPMVSGLPQ
ncbi:putative auxin response factor 21 [Amborella trichopoda]|uniref:Auxin-responsive protein n=1 Tax=Amborella trichopoda TaxID=13333 RepID=U5D0D6_AMBTC|nr:putative auxin response factor 21 [Amborella trichopoda]ERN19046.1 hypothetical protein AMTR_s00061p00078220 [Amborella trichopoda]|eukprot:XP_020531273.1 putative auxin response factor 21 [Amborella trichopoda]